MNSREPGTYIELDEAWNNPGWTSVPNSIARCTTISRRVKGWILEVASHAPGRRLTFTEMLKCSADGRDATYATIKEAVDAGYVTRLQERDKTGRVGIVVYRIHIVKQNPRSGPLPGLPDTAGPDTEKPETKREKTRNPQDQEPKDQEDPDGSSSSATPDGATDQQRAERNLEDRDGVDLVSSEAGSEDQPANPQPPSTTKVKQDPGVRRETKKCSAADDLPRPEVLQLCNQLRDRIIANGCKPPTIGKTWHTAARLLLTRDKRPFMEASWMIDWCQRDEFWRGNILSMPTFRAKYDQLVLKAKSEVERRRNGGGRRGDNRVDRAALPENDWRRFSEQ